MHFADQSTLRKMRPLS